MNQQTTANWRHLSTLTGIFVALMLISNTVAGKIVDLGGLMVPGAAILFPLTYFFGNILTEVYGFKASRKVIWTALGCQVLMSACYLLVEALPAAPFWQNQAAYATILGFVPRVVLASIIAFFCGEFVNSFVLAKLKIATKGRHLWLRANASTIIGEGIDTTIFITAAFAGIFSPAALLTMIGSQYLIKVTYEALATPLTYLVANWLKHQEGQEAWDYKTNFNPFVTE